jgi:hypothetical protein
VRRLVEEACAAGKAVVVPGEMNACPMEKDVPLLRIERLTPLTFRTAGEKTRDAILAAKGLSDISGGIESENGLVKSLRL